MENLHSFQNYEAALYPDGWGGSIEKSPKGGVVYECTED